jgi:hypothetical protein
MNKCETRTFIISFSIAFLFLVSLSIYSSKQNQKILGTQSTQSGVYIQKRPQDQDKTNADNPNIQNYENRCSYLKNSIDDLLVYQATHPPEDRLEIEELESQIDQLYQLYLLCEEEN